MTPLLSVREPYFAGALDLKEESIDGINPRDLELFPPELSPGINFASGIIGDEVRSSARTSLLNPSVK